MFRIESESALKECFREMDREAVVVPHDFIFPIFIRDYLSWLEPSGARTYLVFADPASKKTYGVAFRRDQGRGETVQMCDWCKSPGSSGEIGLLTATASTRKRVGLHLCLDLSCGKKLESRSNLSGESARSLNHELISTMLSFSKRVLF